MQKSISLIEVEEMKGLLYFVVDLAEVSQKIPVCYQYQKFSVVIVLDKGLKLDFEVLCCYLLTELSLVYLFSAMIGKFCLFRSADLVEAVNSYFEQA